MKDPRGQEFEDSSEGKKDIVKSERILKALIKSLENRSFNPLNP